MKSKNIYRAIAVASAISLALVGCSSGGTDGKDASSDSGKVPTITFAAATFAETGRGPLLEAWLDTFNKSQNKVKVVPASIPFPTFAATILTQMGGGTGPDIIRFDASDFAAAAQAGLLEPLDKVVDTKKYDFIKAPDKTNFVDGKRYGVMFEIANYALIYNTDLVKTPPKNFDEFLATAKAATKDGVYGFGMRQTQPEEAGMWQDVMNYVYGFGGKWSDGKKLTLNSPKVIDGINAYKEVYDANVIPKGATASTYRTMFGAGKLAMEVDNGGVAGVIQAMNANLHLSAAANPFPYKYFGGIQTPTGVNKNSKHIDGANAFIKWMLQPKNQESLQVVLGSASVATKTTRSAEQLKKIPYAPVYDALTEYSIPQYVKGFEAKTPAIRKIVITKVISAIQGQQSVKDAMDQAQEEATAAVGG
ncbi:MAG TPA: sugar ABC transporter substrate-binding protein [Lacisediminihabitans sp.]|jgi:multiple sugar transport system substrate-binding protein|nr:sugar ABC transporter substrate-binding protein [Lacisediminihabitans sp.]HXD62327.1 sugar ABC transporter substrate-binding protein [Lacisediminihabitans sp.]